MGFGVLDCLYLGVLGNHNFNGKMVSTGNVGRSEANIQISLSASTSRKSLLGDSDTQSGLQRIETSLPNRSSILNFDSAGGLASPSARFHHIVKERDEISQSVPSSTRQGQRKRFNRVFPRKIDRVSLWKSVKEWIRKPLNMALFLWISCVAVSGAIIFLVMTGMLNGVLQNKAQRNAWFEVNNQILNALFTLMCLYQHPKRFHHLFLLCRWNHKDISQLRGIYCKNGTYKPSEWTHMMVVVVLLHINCFAQYALCGLNLGYKRSKRPAIGVGLCLSVAIAAPAIAGLYSMLSPLGREYNLEMDEEAQDQILTVGTTSSSHVTKLKSMERRFSFASRNDKRIVENNPVWRGGLFDLWEDIKMAYLSLFCCFCVFGWNMERLGFGNMYVHLTTFLLFCTAPFWIFTLAAINIDNETVREVMGITGVVLCVFGLFYGGFWRIQMRKRFNLPANNLCCGKPAIADCATWLFCCWCSLAQEVRTTDFYDIVDDKFCRKEMNENETPMSPLPRENGLFWLTSGPVYPSWGSDNKTKDLLGKDMDSSMKPPIPSFIQREDVTS